MERSVEQDLYTTIKTRILSGNTFLAAALMAANFVNFLFNAVLGRTLSLEQFGMLTVINTFWYLVSIFLNALTATITFQIAKLAGKANGKVGEAFLEYVRIRALRISFLTSVLWVVMIPLTARFFRIEDWYSLLSVTPIIFFGVYSATNRGYLQGNMFFAGTAFIVLAESVGKLAFALAFLAVGRPDLAYLAIPASVVVSCAVTWILLARTPATETSDVVTFPRTYFVSVLLLGMSTAAFLSVDVLLAKHFLSEAEAGAYALLSLTGKMVIFMGTIFSSFMITYVGRDVGAGRNPTMTFYKIFSLTVLSSFVGYVVLGLFGSVTIPLLFGEKALAIVPYASNYTLGLFFFTVSSAIVNYHVTRQQFVFCYTGIAAAVGSLIGILLFHGSLFEMTQVIFVVGALSLLVNSLLHLQSNSEYEEIDSISAVTDSRANLDYGEPRDVAICLPAYNEGNNIGKLLRSLLKQRTKTVRISRIVVVSSASTDNTDEIVQRFAEKDSRVRLVREESRNGKASAINTFLAESDEPIVVVQSTDTIAHRDCIENLCRPMIADGQIGMTGGAPIPENDPNTFLGYVVHTWWWFHRHIPRFGEIIAFRNILPTISSKTAVDEAYIQAKFVQMGYKVVHVDDAVVYNKGSDTVADIIKQRRRIYNGHSRLQKEENVRITHMTKSTLKLLLFEYKLGHIKHLVWLAGGVMIEVIAQLLGRYDKYFKKENPVVWDIATSTKKLSLNLEEEEEQ
jgi:glycosyltransferase involved in cell wall biosynthesis/O-antigen/teichoic acid export membrane protein